jgi:hypothetical protein
MVMKHYPVIAYFNGIKHFLTVEHMCRMIRNPADENHIYIQGNIEKVLNLVHSDRSLTTTMMADMVTINKGLTEKTLIEDMNMRVARARMSPKVPTHDQKNEQYRYLLPHS